MGNAPLARPPQPSDHRVVIPITTTGRPIGTKLRLLPPLCLSQRTNSSRLDLNTLQDDDILLEDDAQQFPPPMQGSAISQQEYSTKLQELEERLATWKGGWALVALFLLCSALVLAFVSVYFFPVFWTSPLFDHPLYQLLASVGFLAICFGVFKYSQKETRQLLIDVEDMFRSWRGRGVHVIMKRISNIEASKGAPRGYSGTNCYCLVITIVQEGGMLSDHRTREEEDTVSVGTVNTDDEL